MIKPQKPADEAERLDALQVLGLVDTPQEERYDRLVRKLAEVLNVPIAYVALIEADRQWMKCRVGPIPGETSRDDSFCGHTILANKPLIVPDALLDPRFVDNPMVIGGPKIRFYAGIPLSSGGHNIGTLCIADTKPRQLADEDLEIIKAFAALILQNIETKPKVFISYCHRDEQWKDRLVEHLRVLEVQGLLQLWDDRQIGAGDAWRGEIQEAMESSDVAILLISANYLTSSFILDEEVPRLLQRRDNEGLAIVPLVIKPCSWQRVSWLEKMNLYPRDGKPLSGGEEHVIDGDLANLAADVLERASRRNPELAEAVVLKTPTLGPMAVLREQLEASALATNAGSPPAPPGPPAPPEARPRPAAPQGPAEQAAGEAADEGPAIKVTVGAAEGGDAPSESSIFRQASILVGRSPSCDVHLADDQRIVSSRHARIDLGEEGATIVDLGSKNFTFLNGRQLEPDAPAELRPADVVTIGDYEIRWAPLAGDPAQSSDGTVFAPDYENPFTEDARLLADVLRRVGEFYDSEASTRRDDALAEALTEALEGDGGHQAMVVVGRLLSAPGAGPS